MRGSLVINDFAPDPSEFLIYGENFLYFFYQCAGNRAIKGAYKPGTSRSCRGRDVACRDAMNPESKFLDVIGTKVLRVFLLAIHSHLH